MPGHPDREAFANTLTVARVPDRLTGGDGSDSYVDKHRRRG